MLRSASLLASHRRGGRATSISRENLLRAGWRPEWALQRRGGGGGGRSRLRRASACLSSSPLSPASTRALDGCVKTRRRRRRRAYFLQTSLSISHSFGVCRLLLLQTSSQNSFSFHGREENRSQAVLRGGLRRRLKLPSSDVGGRRFPRRRFCHRRLQLKGARRKGAKE